MIDESHGHLRWPVPAASVTRPRRPSSTRTGIARLTAWAYRPKVVSIECLHYTRFPARTRKVVTVR